MRADGQSAVQGVYEELAENAHAFLGSPENLQLDGKVIRLSALFKTYADDFGMLPENVSVNRSVPTVRWWTTSRTC